MHLVSSTQSISHTSLFPSFFSIKMLLAITTAIALPLILTLTLLIFKTNRHLFTE
ncbi:uncharacterized protein BDV14DRAFT_175699 [Aspergillus stella-maris]|uniref:uncharacterized protein n=1 Tax=Aspergillus stella-maris TaxID=1810926 RepID=UPI003CCCBC04